MSTDWSGDDADLIAAELARVILGGRGPRRPEQRMDHYGALCRFAIAYRIRTTDVARALLPALCRIAARMNRLCDHAGMQVLRKEERP